MLSKKQIDELAEEGVFLGNIYEITQAIETEVRKQDDALILQMLEALEKVDQAMPFPVARQAITAARARLGANNAGKHHHPRPDAGRMGSQSAQHRRHDGRTG